MSIRFAFALLAAFASAPGLTQVSAPVATPAEAPKPATGKVGVLTTMGTITVELERDRAPITTTNFLKYVDQKRFDGTNFYRATKVGPAYGLIQGGTRGDLKRILPAIAHEPTTSTGLHHRDGTISMARGAPGSADGDFFITIGDMPSMDANPSQPGDNAGFAAFGHVVDGMDVVKRILDAPTSPTEGEGVMKGQMLEPTVRIIQIKRVD